MNTRGFGTSLSLVCLLGLTGGCNSLPAAPASRPSAAESMDPDTDEYSGRLFDRLMGRPDTSSSGQPTPGVTPASAVLPQAADPTAVQPALATAPVQDASQGSKNHADEDSGFSLSDLSPDKIGENLKNIAGMGPNESVARAAFEEGEALYAQRQYQSAAGKFKTAAARWPGSPLEEDALFFLGECYFFTDQYSEAHDTYGSLLKKHDNSRHLDTVASRQFAVGRYWEQLQAHRPLWPIAPNVSDSTRPWFDTFGNAIKAYENVRMYDPTGPLADDSLMAVGNAYFLKGRYEDAAYEYDRLCEDYPKSPHQKKAHLLGMKAKREVYQGALYDGTPLEEAGQLAEQTLIRFRGQLGAEQAHVLQAKNEIDSQTAARDLTMAQYYENRGYYGAARYYYQALLKDHPQTEPARIAQERLAEIQDKPNHPANRFKWLTDVFSSKE